ncbi:uncharacterized protein DC041_0005638 [Schistosoma bovis]|uniref:Phosphatidylinositol-4,5-bisphosphate 4-phosphatase n=1 Tax=Schistosoma bovis TaxID=6184 RepID=A0A430QG22_SCHBO|nr:uncharacterized protein DC041_0005638 [Schistosoma bovis]
MDENTPLVSADTHVGRSVIKPVIERAVTNDGDSQATVNCQPIKGPPTGKQYVRCPCNCLLVCNESTSKVGCPRPECQKVIVIREVGYTSSLLSFLELHI